MDYSLKNLIIGFTIVFVILSNVLFTLSNERGHDTYTIKQKVILGGNTISKNTLVVKARYNITVIRHGQVIAVREKQDDPISIQWYRLIADMMFGFIRDNPVSWLDTSGTAKSWIDTEYCGSNPKMYIALGSGSTTPSIYDYKLSSETLKDVATMSVEDDNINNRYIITYTKSFTIGQDLFLSEVGLLLRVDVDFYTDQTYDYVLVAHDSVSPPIDLVYGDTVTVTYVLTIPYDPAGPFTRWFYNALINYALGYRATGNTLTLKREDSQTGYIDTAYDGYYYGETNKIVGEYTYIEIGSSISTINPVFETYALGSSLQRKRIDNTQFINNIDEIGDNFTIQYIVSFDFTESAAISEIGVSYYTDTRSSSSYAGGYYLWLYWKLPNAIQVDAGDGLRLEIEIIIPYT